jgi:hypothetical protein
MKMKVGLSVLALVLGLSVSGYAQGDRTGGGFYNGDHGTVNGLIVLFGDKTGNSLVFSGDSNIGGIFDEGSAGARGGFCSTEGGHSGNGLVAMSGGDSGGNGFAEGGVEKGNVFSFSNGSERGH